METSVTLKEIERRAYRSTFEDGIYDMLCGALLLIVAWVPVLKRIGIEEAIGYSLLVIPLLLAWFGKRYVTVQRLGMVRFGESRQKKRRLLWLILVVVLFLQLPVLFIVSGQGFMGGVSDHAGLPVVVVMVIAPLLAIAAYFLDYLRLYIYAAALMFGLLHSDFLFRFIGAPLNSLVSFGVPGAIILVFGMTLLYKFVQKYPKPALGANHVSR